MTTHIQKIQALGNRMVSNLNTRGVSATFNDGALTLADKMLEIQHFTNGIFLSADKDIAQTNDTIKFTAVYMENGKTVSGKLILFDGLYTNVVTTTNEDTSYTITGYYKIILPTHENHVDFCCLQGTSDKVVTFGYYPEDQSHYMEIDNDETIFITGNSVLVVGSSIYYVDEDGENAVFDVSDYDTTEVVTPFYIGGVRLETGILNDTTDSYGVATVSYSAKGAGLLNIRAISGIIQSEIYSATDCIVIDNCTLTSHNDACWSGNGLTIFLNNRGNEYTSFEYANNQRDVFLNGLSENCVVEFELKRLDNNFGSGFINIWNSFTGSLIWFSLANMGIGTNPDDWLHLQLRIEPNRTTLTLLSDTTKTVTKDYVVEGAPDSFRLIVNENVTGWYIRNVKVYSL